jgi:cysteine desulfurase
MSGRVYLDHNATSPLRPEARAAMVAALDAWGNPSSVHASGRSARDRVEKARACVAALVGGSGERLVFTGGGTEANALAIWSAAAGGDVTRAIISAIEHEAVVNTVHATGLPVEVCPVGRRGVMELDWLSDRLKRWTAAEGRPFIGLMLANNETGVIQPVAEVAALVHAAGGWLHVDAVQAAGKIAVDMASLGADTLALSAHKLGGPQGAGALLFGEGVRLQPRQYGGGQERGLRAGTENVPALAGFGAACEAAQQESTSSVVPEGGADPEPRSLRASELLAPGSPLRCGRSPSGSEADQAHWRDAAAERLRDAGVTIAGEGTPRLPSTLCLAAPDFPSALQVMALDLAGVEVSAGAACSSGKVKPSGVLEAMGYGELAAGALRASGGWSTTENDWIRFADAWLEAHARRTRAQATRVREYA